MPRVVDIYGSGQRGAGIYSDYSPLKGLLDFENIILDTVEEAGEAFQAAVTQALQTAVDVIRELTGIDLSTYAAFIEGLDAAAWDLFESGLSDAMGLPFTLGALLLQVYHAFDGIDITDPASVIAWFEAAPLNAVNLFNTLPVALFPNLDASLITTGIFLQSSIPSLTSGWSGNIEGSKLVGILNQTLIPALTSTWGGTVASNVLAGVLSGGLIPGLDASKITSGAFVQSLLPSLTSGWGKTIDGSLLVGAISGGLVSGATGIEQAIIDTIVGTLGAVGNDLAALGAALGAIPFINLLGIFGPVNAVATLQAILDNFIQGLTATDSTNTGNSLADANNAATTLYTSVQSAKSIASTVSATIAARAGQIPGYIGVDPTASPPYPISVLDAFATAPTINVTQTNPAGCYIDTPEGGVKKSVKWQGDGTLTNVYGLYADVFSVNLATKVSTFAWSSGNIIASVSGGAIPLWNTLNITPAPYLVSQPGYKWAVRMRSVGPGTYKIVGIAGGWRNPDTSLPVGAQGFTHTIPANFASVTTLSPTNTKNPTWTITPVTGNNCITVDLSAFASATAITAVGVTCGGVAMTQKTPALTNYITGGPKGYVIQYEIHQTAFANYTAGTPLTLAVTTTGGGASGSACIVQGVASTYSNISAVGSAAQSTGTGTSITQTVTGLTANSNTIIRSAIVGTGDVTFSSNNQNLVGTQPGVANAEPILVQDQLAYATSVPFTGAMATGNFAASAFTLTSGQTTPIWVPPAPFTFTDSNNIPWLALGGTTGYSQVPTATQRFKTAGAFTYTIPAAFVTAANAGATIYFDVAICPAGGGGEYIPLQPGAGLTVTYGTGGDAGSWLVQQLQWGVDFPLTTTSFAGVVGAAGHAGTAGTPAGTNGGNSTLTVTGYGTLSTTGGLASGGHDVNDPTFGQSPGDSAALNGVTYTGGDEQQSLRGDGQTPGGAGFAGASNETEQALPGKGAPGIIYITAHM